MDTVESCGQATYRTLVRATSARQVIDYAYRMQEIPSQEEQDLLLDRIKNGLKAERWEDGIYPGPERERIREDGRDARREFAAPYLARVIDANYPNIRNWSDETISNCSDKLQSELVKLMIGVVTLAGRHKEDRPKDYEATWEFLANQISQLNDSSLAEEE